MNKQDIFYRLKKHNIDKNKCIIISGASLVVQDIIPQTPDIDIATTLDYYNKLDWNTKIGDLNVEIKFVDDLEIGVALYDPLNIVEIDGYKFSNLKSILKVKKLLNRDKDKNIIKKLELIIKEKDINN